MPNDQQYLRYTIICVYKKISTSTTTTSWSSLFISFQSYLFSFNFLYFLSEY